MPSVDMDELTRRKISKGLASSLRPANSLAYDDTDIKRLLGKLVDQNDKRYDLDKERIAKEDDDTEDFRKTIEREIQAVIDGESSSNNSEGGGLLGALAGKRRGLTGGIIERRGGISKRKRKKLEKEYDEIYDKAHSKNTSAKDRIHARKRLSELEEELENSNIRPYIGVGPGLAKTAGAGLGATGVYESLKNARKTGSGASAATVLGNAGSAAASGAVTGASIGMVFGPEGALIGAGVGGVAGAVSSLVVQYSDVIKSVLSSIGDGISSGITSLTNNVKDIASNIGKTISNIYTAISNGLSATASFLYDNTVGLLPKTAQDFINKGAGKVKDEIEGVAGSIGSKAKGIYDSATSSIGDEYKSLANSAKITWEKAKKTASASASVASSNITNAAGDVTSAVGGVAGAAASGASAVNDKLGNPANQVLGQVTRGVNGEAGGALARTADSMLPVGTTATGKKTKNGEITDAQAQKAAYIMDQAKQIGYSQTAALGVLGNMSQESSLDPYARGDGGTAFGLGQWHIDRVKDILNATGIDVRKASFQDQVRAYLWELNNSPDKRTRSAGQMLRNNPNLSVYDANALIAANFERPADKQGLEGTWRTQQAMKFANNKDFQKYMDNIEKIDPNALNVGSPSTSFLPSLSALKDKATQVASSGAGYIEKLLDSAKEQVDALNKLATMKEGELAASRKNSSSSVSGQDMGFSWEEIPMGGGCNGLGKVAGA